MSTSAPTVIRRRPFGAYLVALIAIVAAGMAVWWYGPWNEENRYKKASLLSLHQAADANPNDPKAWRRLAIRLADTGNASLAEPPLRKAYELNPTDPAVGTGLGELLLATNRVPEAFQVLKATVGHNPDFALARMALGRLYKRKGSYLNAAEEFQAALKADKTLSDGWYELATCNLQMQKGAEARQAIAEAIRQAPNEAHYLALKSSIDAVVGATDEGIETAKKAAKMAPDSPKVQINLANILLAHHRGPEDLDEAERVIAHIEKIDPELRIIHYQKGELHRRRQNWSQAEQHLVKAAQVTPYLDEVFFSLSQVQQRLGKKKHAEETLSYYRKRQALRQQVNEVGLALTRKPDDVKLHVRLAKLYLEAGDTDTAVSTVRNAMQIDPNSPELQELVKKMGPPPGAAPAPQDEHAGHDHAETGAPAP